ncbi:sugar transferase [Vibrio tubiashii]|uniref:sugar transferase n=1 Tax=Vibrio tubiashii TaxID=29498 RepID=UPI00234E850C|nr:sugar transferase [Vibrio tubiashii]WCP67294.1 sugar transferase [Vibrio tubiashii]
MVGNIHINDKRFEDKLIIKKYTPNLGLRELGNGILIDVLTPITKQEEQIIIDCSVAQIPIYHINQLQERLEQKVSSIHLSDRTIQALNPESNYFRIKSTLDILLAFMGIVILLPIMATIYLMIKIQQDGSAIYKQKRIGQHNQTFTIYKFRTMVPVVSEGSAKFASTEQHRISRFGRFLRKTRLDEIPQLFNVLKGEMSIIGPRPEQPCFANQFAEDIPFYNFRHIVKPGITGWAQVTQGYTHSFESTIEKLAYDFYYLKHLSWQLDFEIYLKTIRVIVTGKGAI